MGCGASTIVKYITLNEIRFPDYFNGDRADNATRLLHRVAWNLHPNGCEEERMDANLWIELMRGALMKLFEFRHVLNDTNVYPTPDRDTGRNMMWTMRGGLLEVLKETETKLGETMKKFAKGTTQKWQGQGNSQTILTYFFWHFSQAMMAYENATIDEFMAALLKTGKKMYGALPRPKKGTMISVIKDSIQELAEEHKKSPLKKFAKLFDLWRIRTNKVLLKTPHNLMKDSKHILRRRGVLDSGGQGFAFIVEGMSHVLNAPHRLRSDMDYLGIQFVELPMARVDDVFQNAELTQGAMHVR
jgi:dihydroxyacetone kinase-like predicted kinase